MFQLVPGARSPRLASLFALLAAACGPVLACSSSEGGDTSSSSSSSGGSSGEVSDAGVQGADGGGSSGQTATDAGGDAATPGCGRNTTPCGEGGSCEGAPDCASGVCRSGKCGTVSPSNGFKDGDETDVDCGGTKAPACADGKGCGVAADCTSGVCTGGKCQVPTSTDGVKNGDETGVDCGGTTGKGCAAGQGCKSNADCDKLKCDLGTNKCLAASNADGIKNGTETDVDCGGGAPTNAPRCAQDKACAVDGDCANNVRCDANAKTCNAPTNGDGLKNGTETDVDCGGGAPTNAPKCAGGAACLVVADCVDGDCTNNVCVAPTSADGKKNGNESDVDCGSSGAGTPTNAARCDAGKTCANDGDCRSGGCNHKGVCAAARSCTMQHGGTTCGTGDSSRANQNEDCCASDLVPTYNLEGYNNALAAFRLDRYQITSGRIRRFLTAVNGDVRTWVQANRAEVLAPAQLPAAADAFLPTGWTQADSNDDCRPEGNAPGDPVIKCNYGALNQVSGYRYTNEPGGDGGYGCYMSAGGYGTRTFWMTNAERALTGETQHLVSRDRVEQKAMTCGTYYIYAAFCAWDGGRLETFDEYNAAYGGNGSAGRVYPWGSDVASRAIGFEDLFTATVAPITNYGYVPPADGNGQYSTYNASLTAQQRADLLVRVDRANLRWNYFDAQILDYRAPLQGRATTPIAGENAINVANDQTVAVAPPGRYPNGAGRYGHRDLLGNTIEITATVVNGNNRRWARNGSFETAHFNATTMTGNNGYNFTPLAKYGRAGARCVRPVDGYLPAPLP